MSIKKPKEYDFLEDLANDLSFFADADDFLYHARNDGYDGIIIYNDEEFGGTSYVVFDSNQIKSATNNNGEFSSGNPDIRFSKGESEDVTDIPQRFEDSPEKMRERGFVKDGGGIYYRHDKLDTPKGKQVTVRFSDNEMPIGYNTVIEALDLSTRQCNLQSLLF